MYLFQLNAFLHLTKHPRQAEFHHTPSIVPILLIWSKRFRVGSWESGSKRSIDWQAHEVARGARPIFRHGDSIIWAPHRCWPSAYLLQISSALCTDSIKKLSQIQRWQQARQQRRPSPWTLRHPHLANCKDWVLFLYIARLPYNMPLQPMGLQKHMCRRAWSHKWRTLRSSTARTSSQSWQNSPMAVRKYCWSSTRRYATALTTQLVCKGLSYGLHQKYQRRTRSQYKTSDDSHCRMHRSLFPIAWNLHTYTYIILRRFFLHQGFDSASRRKAFLMQSWCPGRYSGKQGLQGRQAGSQLASSTRR